MKTRIFVLLFVMFSLLGWVAFARAQAPEPEFFTKFKAAMVKAGKARGIDPASCTFRLGDDALSLRFTAEEIKKIRELGVPVDQIVSSECVIAPSRCFWELDDEGQIAKHIDCVPNPNYKPVIKSDGWTDKPV